MKAHKKTCEQCGRKFTSQAQRSKYCSPTCKIEAAKKKRKEWEAKNPDYMKNYMKSYRQEKKAAQNGA
jgi:hypothetical protein